jgi:hypothetical protein
LAPGFFASLLFVFVDDFRTGDVDVGKSSPHLWIIIVFALSASAAERRVRRRSPPYQKNWVRLQEIGGKQKLNLKLCLDFRYDL